MVAGEVFGAAGINQAESRVDFELALEIRWSDQKRAAHVLLFHRLAITLHEMALQIVPDAAKGKRSPRRTLALAAAFSLALWFWQGAETHGEAFQYRRALAGRKLAFPADHYAHPDYRTEWWYYTGHLRTAGGKRYGYQVTFFRFGLRDRQSDWEEQPIFTDLYMAHFALSDFTAKSFRFRERINRGQGDKAGAATERYHVWNEDWMAQAKGKRHEIFIKDRDTTLRLVLEALKPPVLHGDNGHSQKGEGEGHASYYYSLTRMETAGALTVDGKEEAVRGVSWMDHEFGSDQLDPQQVGWDWFSIQLDNNVELMLYLLRRTDGSVDPFSSGTLVSADGETTHLRRREFRVQALDKWKSAASGATYPVKWKVSVPTQELELEIEPPFPEQELITSRSTRVTYWEGAVGVHGTFKKRAIAGQGYVEMTGYAGKLNF
jgi:predicted secreted hydrolase